MGSAFRRKKSDGTKAAKYTIKYQDANGEWRKEAAYTDKRLSMVLLTQRENEAAQERLGLIDKPTKARGEKLVDLIKGFETHLRSRQCSDLHIHNTLRNLRTAINWMGARMVSDLSASQGEAFLVHLVENGRAAKTRDTYLSGMSQFAKWLVMEQKLRENPFVRIRRLVTPSTRDALAVEKPFPFTLEQIESVAQSALVRVEQNYASRNRILTGDLLEETRRNGMRRALLYLMGAYTATRAGALLALRWEDVKLSDEIPHIVLIASKAKTKVRQQVPLPRWLATRLTAWREEEAAAAGAPIPESQRIFPWAVATVDKAFQKDCDHAGIPRVDGEGRKRQFRSLRTGLATLCARNGVSAAHTQQLLGHTSPEMTLNVYTQLDQTDLSAAMNKLPEPIVRPPVRPRSATPIDTHRRALGGPE